MLSWWPLEVKYNWKGDFESHFPSDAKYDDASVILNVIYDIESKTLMVLCPVDHSMQNMIVLWFVDPGMHTNMTESVTNKLEGLFCVFSMTLRCEIWSER
jgi:hypothetical protein